MQIDRLVGVAGKDQLSEFSHMFSQSTTSKLTDDHLWFSVVARPAQSRFSRVERLSCCLCLFFTSMLTSAMFYGQQTDDTTDSISIGPLSFSFEQASIKVLLLHYMHMFISIGYTNL